MLTRIRKTGISRAAALFLTLTMLFAMLVPAGAAVTKEQINNLKSQAATLNTKKNALQKDIDKLATSKNAALSQKTLLEQKINILREEIAVSEQAIASLTEMIQQKEVELAEAKEKEAQYYDLFCDRVRDMEEGGEVSYWSVLFQASSFSDLLDRVNIISEVMEYDNGVMDALAAARQAVENAKADLEESKTAEEQQRNALSAQKADLVAQEQSVDALISQINSQSSVYASQMEELAEDAKSISGQISSAEATYAAQLEAARKAEQAAAAAAAAKKAAASSSSSGGGSVAVVSGKGGYIWPVPSSHHVSSKFGYRICPYHGRELHGGIDITASYGATILAAKSGVVIISTYGGSYGNYVVIGHGDGTRTLYAHMSSRAVSAGASVSQGQTIGYVGSTGNSTGPHCHFEVWTGSSSNSRVNPLNYF